jgi:hypothetical protein
MIGSQIAFSTPWERLDLVVEIKALGEKCVGRAT